MFVVNSSIHGSIFFYPYSVGWKSIASSATKRYPEIYDGKSVIVKVAQSVIPHNVNLSDGIDKNHTS